MTTWTAPDPSSMEPLAGPLTGPDRPMLEGYLAWERFTLANICAGLDGEQLARRAIPASNLSLLGIVRHLAKVERTWFRVRLTGGAVQPLYDLALGQDYDFDHLDPEQAPEAFATWQEEIRLADETAATKDFETTVQHHDETMSLRLVYIHMIAEYAQHNGHADLIREAIDGVTGR